MCTANYPTLCDVQVPPAEVEALKLAVKEQLANNHAE